MPAGMGEQFGENGHTVVDRGGQASAGQNGHAVVQQNEEQFGGQKE